MQVQTKILAVSFVLMTVIIWASFATLTKTIPTTSIGSNKQRWTVLFPSSNQAVSPSPVYILFPQANPSQLNQVSITIPGRPTSLTQNILSLGSQNSPPVYSPSQNHGLPPSNLHFPHKPFLAPSLNKPPGKKPIPSNSEEKFEELLHPENVFQDPLPPSLAFEEEIPQRSGRNSTSYITTIHE